MAIYQDGAIVADRFARLAADAPLPEAGAIALPLARWRAERDSPALANRIVGVEIDPGEDMSDIVDHIASLAMVALRFPKFNDGRPFSAAHLLRERHNFDGEIRATGEVLFDQLGLMLRSGFSSFEITDARTLAVLERGARPILNHFYQPGHGIAEIPAGTRPWARIADAATVKAAPRQPPIEDDLHLIVIDQGGSEHRLDALEGWRAMEVIRDWGLPIKAECGGACACASCHVYVAPEWQTRLPPPQAEEVDCLDGALGVEDNSRLSCQILMSPALNGLRLRLAPGSEPL